VTRAAAGHGALPPHHGALCPRAAGALAVALATLLLASACTVGPDYVRPPVIAPEAYTEGQGWVIARPSDALARGEWWKIFADPRLDALEARVSLSNQNLAVAEAQYREARALVREARAAFFPTVSVGLGYTRSRQSTTFDAGSGAVGSGGTAAGTAGGLGGFSGQPRSDFEVGLDFSWEIDVWGRIRRTVESNRASAQASAGDLEAARLSFQAELAQDYFQLRTLDAQRQLLDDSVAAFETFLRLTQDRHASGVASQADVAQALTQLKTTRAQAIDVGVLRAQLEHAIAILMGEAPERFRLPAAPLDALPPGIPIGVPSQLLERRPDIAAAERRMAAANAQIGVAVAAYYPTVTLNASSGLESGSLARWFTAASRFWSVGPGISETVFDGGLRGAQTDAARAVFDATVATYRQTVLAAFQGVEDNLAALRILEQEGGVEDEAVKAAQESVRLTTSQYRAGTVSYLNVVTAQTIALTDEVTAIQIRGRRMAAAVLLIQALGGGWQAGDLPTDADVTKRPP
jgi:NodT family efflux transporter outer membrane factor (OMF) lipoprotein